MAKIFTICPFKENICKPLLYIQHDRAGQSLFPVHILYIPNPRLFNLETIDIWGYIILCLGRGCCPVHDGMFSNIHDFYSLGASSTLPFVKIENVYRHCQIYSDTQNHSCLRINDLNYNFPLIPSIGT